MALKFSIKFTTACLTWLPFSNGHLSEMQIFGIYEFTNISNRTITHDLLPNERSDRDQVGNPTIQFQGTFGSHISSLRDPGNSVLDRPRTVDVHVDHPVTRFTFSFLPVYVVEYPFGVL